MTASFRLDGSVALVTGAAGGIGARVALGLAEFGADVGCVDVVDPAKTVAAIEEVGRRAVGRADSNTRPGRQPRRAPRT